MSDLNAPADTEWVNAKPTDDPLLTCLYLLTKLYHRPCSEDALKAGLPLVDHRLTPELFVRASRRIHLTAQIIKRPLTKIKQLALPAVLLLKDQQACILLRIIDNKRAEIMQPEAGAGAGSSEVNLADLDKEYLGSAIFVQPAYEFTDRSGNKEKGTSKQHWFWSVFKKAWPAYGETLMASFLINAFGLALPLFVMNVYDRVVPNHAVDTLWVLVIGIIIVFTFEFIMRTLRGYLIDVAGKKIDINLSANIFEQVLGLRMGVRPGSVGAFANSIQGFESFRDFITSSTITVLIDLPFVFLYIAVVAMIGGDLALVPLVAVPIVIIVGYLLQLPIKDIIEDTHKYNNEKQATLIETLMGVETIKSEGAEGAVQSRWEHVVGLAARAGVKIRLIANASINFSILAQEIVSIVVVIMGVYKITQGDLTVGGLIACTILASRGLAPMSQVAALLTRYHQAVHSMQSIGKVMDLPVERSTSSSVIHREQLAGAIQFRQVSFQYPNQTLPALKDFSLDIRAGEHVGILGRIGSGKTTIAKLVLGLYQPTSGSILIDGAEIKQIDPVDLRHHIGYVPQDILLFYGSIKSNIAMGAPYLDDDAIIKAAKIAGVDRFVNQDPEGYARQVGERGMLLSGGQRQSIAIARAFLLDPRILLMDEPTNDMDDMTENQLKTNLMQYIQGKTLLLMTHKPSLLALVDRLIIIENGHLVADGPRDEVIKALSSKGIAVPKTWSS